MANKISTVLLAQGKPFE